MKLIGKGRAADVYAAGPNKVLRRYRLDVDCAAEAETMRRARAAGVAVPEVFDVDGRDIVMERMSGRTMLEELASKPWRLRYLAATLAQAHVDVATLNPDDFADVLEPLDDLVAAAPDRPLAVAHLDLHPDNVMLTPDGAMIFDWANAAIAPAGADVATTWVLMSFSDVDTSALIRPFVKYVRSSLIDRFVAASEAAGANTTPRLRRAIAQRRLADRGTLNTEAQRINTWLAANSAAT